ncbi:class I SAM-dependent methyltransferase [Desulforamulus ruminis]|uniref:Methyltransferase type 11 n=1 Tax=Desulforamulus ruminis (strain ATCC 23193 / DSM 2154 / NCIMB 8452 / DL) TaxID=696281 RepID=F6DP37_DESRL|nr:class I SAM-dependent methyltransferase [Desulforamulus ruminis]AEG61866.1 Methyltransferase type 11 [Desulforamulus ruminis DSM 2154]
MYDEKQDFIHHEREVAAFWNIAKIQDKCKNMTILDLGAGQGMHAGFLSKHFKTVYASDVINYSSLYGGEFMKLLGEKHIRNNYEYFMEKIHFVETDAMNLIYKNDFVDVVFSVNTFEHIPDTFKALEEIIRVTVREGLIYISFDPIWCADSGSHFYDYVSEPWEHLVNNNYEDKMLSCGATPDQVNEYKVAMNRKRPDEHKKIFDYFIKNGYVSLEYFNLWKGTINPNSCNHKNFKKARDIGYSTDELLTRGMCYLLRKN